eukprot:365494-Chlamydomonas_euryale.AAC.8
MSAIEGGMHAGRHSGEHGSKDGRHAETTSAALDRASPHEKPACQTKSLGWAEGLMSTHAEGCGTACDGMASGRDTVCDLRTS